MKSWPISTMHFNLCWNCTRPSERWGFCTPVIPWIWFFSLVKNRRKLFQTAASAVVTKKRGKRWNLIFTLVRVQAKQRALASSFLGSHISWTMSLLTNEEKERIKGLRCHAEVTKKVKGKGQKQQASRVFLMKNFLTVTRFSLRASVALPAPPNPFHLWKGSHEETKWPSFFFVHFRLC